MQTMAVHYPEELINEIIAANDIVDIVSAYVKLKRSGNDYKGLCPFHSEKTPSFHVSGDKQLYYCFGCGAGGTVLQFIRNIENLDFVEGVKYLAERARIALPEGDDGVNEAYEKKQTLYKMNAQAARFFYKNLMSEQGKIAQSYFANRGLDPKTVTSFGLGFATSSFDGLTNHLTNLGFDVNDMISAGLARKSEKTGKVYDFFRNRIMFPIIDVRGNVIAFGGRVMDDSLPKYLNSPDTAVFNKSRTLFALNFAKKSCSERMILCEGYMVVIALHKAGFTNAVAALGTAFTVSHAKIMARYTKEVVLCYDSDGAGQKATAKVIEILANENIRMKVLKIPGAKDPDEFIKKNGAAAFGKLLDGSQNSVLYKIETLKSRYDKDNIDQRIELISKMAEIFADIDNPIEQEVLVKDTASEVGISADSIFAQINLIKSKKNKKAEKEIVRRAAKVENKENLRIREECMLAALMLEDGKVYSQLKDDVTEDFFTSPACREFIKAVHSANAAGIKTDAASIISKMPPDLATGISGYIFAEKPYADTLKAAMDIYSSIIKKEDFEKKDINSAEELEAMIKRLKNQKK